MEQNPLFFAGQFGIERETLRVDANGRLAQTPHPFGDSPLITRDFCENQVELITPVCDSIPAAAEALRRLDAETRAVLAANGETLWLYSNPPYFESEAEIPVANFTGVQSNKRDYREKLERRYGKRLMLFSGIHFNLSFSEAYLRSIHTEGGFDDFRDRFYLRLYQQISRHSWLPLLLTAASPVYDRSLDADGGAGAVRSRYASMRSGKRGYWNEWIPVLRFDSLQSFVGSIREYVDKGLLFSASELYLPVRLKPRGENALHNLEKGISHIELRMFDLNPLEPLGISETDLEFTHLLLMYLSTLPAFDYTPAMQRQAVRDHQNAALYDLEDVEIDGVPILTRAEQIITEMLAFFEGDASAQAVLRAELNKLSARICTQIPMNVMDRG